MARSHTEKWFDAVIGGVLAAVPIVFLTLMALRLLLPVAAPLSASAAVVSAAAFGLLTAWIIARYHARQSGITRPRHCEKCG